MASIELTRGRSAIVDDGDLETLQRFTWQAAFDGRYWYAVSSYLRDGRFGKYRMHRLIVGAGKDQFVDHINGDGLDNRRVNLRVCSRAENSRNRKPSWFRRAPKGVAWHAKTRKWQARINFDRRQIHLGYFHTPEEAAAVYDAASLRLFGKFAAPNNTDLRPPSVDGVN